MAKKKIADKTKEAEKEIENNSFVKEEIAQKEGLFRAHVSQIKEHLYGQVIEIKVPSI